MFADYQGREVPFIRRHETDPVGWSMCGHVVIDGEKVEGAAIRRPNGGYTFSPNGKVSQPCAPPT
jgi:hypothetical protein